MSHVPQTPETLLEGYTVLRQLGKGGFAKTYLVRRRDDGALCVVKEIPFVKDQNPKTLDLFEREVRVLGRLDHPGIPKFLDSKELATPEGLRLYVVQEYIEGENLYQLFSRKGRIPEAEVLKIGIEVCRILEYLQAQQPPIIHRDIKPSNVMLDQDEEVFLIDFGAVHEKRPREEEKDHYGAGSTFVGTFGYIPWEQYAGRAVPESDLYALGMTLIYLLSGKDPAELGERHMRIQFRPHVQISKATARVLERAIDPDWRQRYRDAAALREALELALAGGPERVTEPDFSDLRPSSSPQRFPWVGGRQEHRSTWSTLAYHTGFLCGLAWVALEELFRLLDGLRRRLVNPRYIPIPADDPQAVLDERRTQGRWREGEHGPGKAYPGRRRGPRSVLVAALFFGGLLFGLLGLLWTSGMEPLPHRMTHHYVDSELASSQPAGIQILHNGRRRILIPPSPNELGRNGSRYELTAGSLTEDTDWEQAAGPRTEPPLHFQTTPEGSVWALSPYELVCFAGGDPDDPETVLDSSALSQASRVSSEVLLLSAFHALSKEELWVGTSGGVLLRKKGERLYRMEQQVPGSPTPVTAIRSTRSGLWVGHAGGLLRYDQQKMNWRPVQDLPAQAVLALEEDDEGRLLAATSEGLWLEQNETLVQVWKAQLGALRTIQRLPGGRVLAATAQGALQLEFKGAAVEAQLLLPERAVRSLTGNPQGQLWAVTDRSELLQRQAPGLPWSSEVQAAGGLEGGWLHGLSDGQGRIWMAHQGRLLLTQPGGERPVEALPVEGP